MRWRSHGANPYKLFKQFGINMPDDILDFSTNTNVIMPSMDFDMDISKLIADYPDDDAYALMELLAQNNGVSSDCILVTNGSNEAIYILVSLYDNIAIMQPTYSEYKSAALAYKKRVTDIFLLDDLKDDIDLLIICNPNNPTGKYLDSKAITKLAIRCENQGTDLVIDEAYINFVLKGYHGIDIKQHKNIYILRSMTKTYNLAGIRLGYVMAEGAKLAKIKQRQPTWSVNSLAQHYGAKFIEDDIFLEKTINYYKKETIRLVNAIGGIGYKTLASDTHYFLMETKDDEKLIKFMLQKGIVLRHTRNFAGLDGRYVRICTREKSANEKLIAALCEFKESL